MPGIVLVAMDTRKYWKTFIFKFLGGGGMKPFYNKKENQEAKTD